MTATEMEVSNAVPEQQLKDVLAERRRQMKLTLRDVEEKTGIKNAHLSQIETGAITQPTPNLLWALAEAYDLDFKKLLRLAGLTKERRGADRGAVLNAAFRALDDMTPSQQAEVLDFLEQTRKAGGAKRR
jgi:transcriptional regulator with XRE-family HTH domain